MSNTTQEQSPKRIPDILEKMTLRPESGITDSYIDTDVEHIRRVMAHQGYHVTAEVVLKVWASISTSKYHIRWQMPQQIRDMDLFQMVYPFLMAMPEPGGPIEVISHLAADAAAIVDEIVSGNMTFVPKERRDLFESALKQAADALQLNEQQFEAIVRKNEFGGYENPVLARFFVSLSDFMDVLRQEYPNDSEEDNFKRYIGKDYYAFTLRSYVERALKCIK
jgi:hypothetical protein